MSCLATRAPLLSYPGDRGKPLARAHFPLLNPLAVIPSDLLVRGFWSTNPRHNSYLPFSQVNPSLHNLAARQQLSTHCLDLLPTPNVGLPLCATSRAGFGSPRSARLRAIAYGLPMPVCGG